jgi:hypothetical protein
VNKPVIVDPTDSIKSEILPVAKIALLPSNKVAETVETVSPCAETVLVIGPAITLHGILTGAATDPNDTDIIDINISSFLKLIIEIPPNIELKMYDL